MRRAWSQLFGGRFWALALKELRQIRRDRRLTISLIVPPILQILLFGFALDSDVRNLRLGLVDESRTAESRELIDAPAHPYTKLLLSAVPNPHAGLRTDQEIVRGEIPSLVNPPAGCPLAPRCPHVMPECREAMPGITHIGPRHWVRCYLHGPGDDRAAMATSPAAAG